MYVVFSFVIKDKQILETVKLLFNTVLAALLFFLPYYNY